jgi:Tol biopolymer transport system component/predicted Ser/Thr protein kinase
MTLSSSTRLGPYEILAPLGAGGMGEVYRARDTRLDRTVAIKVLPSHLSGNDEFRQRFEREARAVSSLNHPHICTLYDVGHQDGIDYLVMEFIEGDSLADRLAKSALPAEQVLRYAIQIADALDKAHRAGIVHRDLKPGNIMLTKSGAKLLDFGLAKLQGSGSGLVSGLTSLPTERHSLTGEGMILGTFQYMAPEQLEGKEADHRTDLFAFGAVVYEMATGKKAFSGKSQASLISAIMSSDPPAISTLQPMTPTALDRVVKTCLAKDPEDRWQTAHDVVLELKWIAEGGLQTGVPAPALALRNNRERLAWIASAVLLLTSLVLAISYLQRPAAELMTTRFMVTAPEKVRLRDQLAVSPDGWRLAFIARDADGKKRMWIRSMDSMASQLLVGTEEAEFPFWSPDSRFIAFFAENKLKKISVAGGPPQVLCPVGQDPRGGSWTRDGVIVFTPDSTQPIHKVSASGGSPVKVTSLDESRKESSHRWPHFLPDGRHFLFCARSYEPDKETICAASVDSNARKQLIVCKATSVAYVAGASTRGGASGYLLFVLDHTLMAQPFDADKLELSGDPLPVAQEVMLAGEDGPTGYGSFSVSENGVLAFRAGASETLQPTWFDRSGKKLGLAGPPGSYFEPSFSPDEKRVALARRDAEDRSENVWLFDFARSTFTRFTFQSQDEGTPVWSPDGSNIVFSSSRGQARDLFLKPLSGAGAEQPLVQSDLPKYPDDWSRDGRFILYDSFSASTKGDIWVLSSPLGDKKSSLYLQTPFNETHAQFSPDGKWVAYGSDESGKSEVYVQSFPISGAKWLVSTNGGDQPIWRKDGKELFYLAADKKLTAVPVKTGTIFEAGTPLPLFEVHVVPKSLTDDKNEYLVTADGQRFLVLSISDDSVGQPITVVLNWTAELKRQ